MKLAEIEEKIVELALIYQDEKQGADSAAAKKLLAELAQENSENIGKANLSLRNKIIRGKVKISQSTLGTVLNNIKATGNSNEDVTQAPTQPEANEGTSKSTTKDIAELGELLKEAENQPAKPKAEAVKQKVKNDAPKAQPINPDNPQDKEDESKVKSAKVKSSDVEKNISMLPSKGIQKEIHEYISKDEDEYSDTLGDYIEDKENALKVLNFLHKNYTSRSGKLNLQVMRLALIAYSVGNKDTQFADVAKSIIEKLSELSLSGYLEKNKDAKYFPKDLFLCDVKKVFHNEYKDILDEITKKHVQSVLEKLSEDDKKKYLRMLNKKNGLEQFNPNLQNKQNSKKENTKSTETKTGDTIMADKEVKFDYNTIDSEKSEIKVESDKSLVLSLQDKDGNMLVFTAAAQKDEKAVDAEGKETTVHHSIFDDDFPTQYAVEINGKKEVYRVSGSTNDPMDKEILELVKKQMNKKLLETLIESEARAVDGEEATIKAEREEFLKKMGKDNKEDFDEIYELLKKKKENDDSLSPEDKEKELERLLAVRNKYVPLGIDADSEEKKKGVDAPELADWIKKKIKDYKDMADGKLEGCPKLTDYHHDETIKDGFVAAFNGGEIHYTTPNNVTVSKESGLTIFEALVTEPDNKGRVVNFGPNLEHNQAVMLFAACVMHGNPIGENQPKISQADMDMLKEELIKQGREEDWNNFATKIKEMLGVKEETAKPKTFDDETKAKIKEALGRQYDMASLESSGLIRKLPDGTPCKNPEKKEDGTDKYSDEDFKKYLDLSGKQAEDKKFLAEKFIENPEAVRDLMKELVNEKTGKTEDKETTITDRREMVKMKMEIRNKDGANNEKAFIGERRQKLQEEMKMALGIIPNKDGEKKVDLDYIKNNHINAYTYGRLGGTSEDVAKQCGPIKEGGDVMKEFAAGKQTLKELTDKVKGGGRGA